MPFTPLPDDCVNYYSIDPNIEASWPKLWLEFNTTCKTGRQRLDTAKRVGLPCVIGILKSEIASSFSKEKIDQVIDSETKVVPFTYNDLKGLSERLVDMLAPGVEQPILVNIIHSWLNYDVQHFQPQPSDAWLSFDNKIIIPDSLRAPHWHPDDGLALQFRPSRRMTLRTSIHLQYKDADGNEKTPNSNEILLMTGDTYHRSSVTNRSTPSKYVQLGIFPYVE